MRVTTVSARNFAVVELDKAFIASTMVPVLVQRHFPDTGSDRVHVQIAAGKGDVLFSRGLTAGQTIDLKTADASAGFFGLRLEVFRGFVAATTATAGPGAAASDATVTALRRQEAEAAVQQQRAVTTSRGPERG
jgi:hypothetical protein